MPKEGIVEPTLCHRYFCAVMEFYIRPDCMHFRGDIPCRPHKEHMEHCKSCGSYQKITHKILIIKLGAMGDVIRTTPLVTKFRKEYPQCKITWVTLTPDILPKSDIHEILPFNLSTVLYITQTDWDIVVNLDKEKEAGALLKQISSVKKMGYILTDGVIQPYNQDAYHKFNTGMFDDVSKANTKSYPEEIFEICGYIYKNEPYLLDAHTDKGYEWNFKKTGPVIGLNTGCGDRWTTRLWSSEKWIELIHLLQKDQYTVLLLGGKQEEERNLLLQEKTGAEYLGNFPLPQFINLIWQCDLVVTQVTMAMHITLGLGKKIVLMNNIFNPYEFNVHAPIGKIVAPSKECKCYYRGVCVDGQSCMEKLIPLTVFDSVKEVLAY